LKEKLMPSINKIKIIIPNLGLLLILVILSSCSQNIDGNVDLPYTEEIVVRGVLEAGQPVKGIMLSKTMPTLDTFSMSQAEISNVDAFIMNNNIKYQLHYVGNSLFDCDSLTAQSGNTYTLTVHWNGKTVTATTIVPYALDFDSITVITPYHRRHDNEWTVGLSAITYINTNVVVVGGYYLIDTTGINPYIKTYTSKAYRMQDTNSNGARNLVVFQKSIIDTNLILYDSLQYQMSLFVESYDPQFYDYFSSRMSGDSPNSSFGLSGSNIRWNVKGDGVGLFVGYASKVKRYKGI
jgi:hypothetical protein